MTTAPLVDGQTQLHVRRLGPHRWQLTDDFVSQGNRDRFVVEAGFETDFASVPRLAQAVVPRTGNIDEAAVRHDKHCKQLAAGTCAISSRDVDGLFRHGVRSGGDGPIVAWLAWTGVRWGALRNPARREDWWLDAHQVLAVSLLALLAVAAVWLGPGLALGWALGVG